MTYDPEKEKRDIERLNKLYPKDKQISEVAYDKKGNIIAVALKDAPPPILIDTSRWYGKDYCGPR